MPPFFCMLRLTHCPAPKKKEAQKLTLSEFMSEPGEFPSMPRRTISNWLFHRLTQSTQPTVVVALGPTKLRTPMVRKPSSTQSRPGPRCASRIGSETDTDCKQAPSPSLPPIVASADRARMVVATTVTLTEVCLFFIHESDHNRQKLIAECLQATIPSATTFPKNFRISPPTPPTSAISPMMLLSRPSPNSLRDAMLPTFGSSRIASKAVPKDLLMPSLKMLRV